MKKSLLQENKSLKTFLVYSGIVLFFILIALAVKLFFIIQSSKFDGRHQFILFIVQDNKVKEVIKFNPSDHEISVLQLKDGSIEIIPDATVSVNDKFHLDKNVSGILNNLALKYNSVKTDLTLIDLLRLTLLGYESKVVVIDEQSIKDIFVDASVISENITIQIINASGVSGMGKTLEKILTNLGYNIVEINTSRSEEKFSKIQYFGEKTYTLKKLKRLLGFSLDKIDKKGIADIIIIIGQDGKTVSKFSI